MGFPLHLRRFAAPPAGLAASLQAERLLCTFRKHLTLSLNSGVATAFKQFNFCLDFIISALLFCVNSEFQCFTIYKFKNF
jgi:hypothetical protein